MVFRTAYPRGRNFVVAPYIAKPYTTHVGGFEVRVLGPAALREELERTARPRRELRRPLA
jgi:hypothetical protein